MGIELSGIVLRVILILDKPRGVRVERTVQRLEGLRLVPGLELADGCPRFEVVVVEIRLTDTDTPRDRLFVSDSTAIRSFISHLERLIPRWEDNSWLLSFIIHS